MKITVAFVLLLTLGLGLSYASDIAFYVGHWNTDGWYDESQFKDVETIINETGKMFKDIKKFDDDHLKEFEAWAKDNMNDGEFDIIWLNGCMPSALYPYQNKEPDGSVAEGWLDGGNMFINVGDWFAYVSYECGGARCTQNGSQGAANILDLGTGIITAANNTMMKVTPTGKKYLPSLESPCKTDRPVVLTEVKDPWEVAAIFASLGGSDDPAKESQADPVVIHNKQTNGYVAIINQAAGGPAGWLKDRGKVCAEFIKNWVAEVVGLTPVEPQDKLATTWGEIKR